MDAIFLWRANLQNVEKKKQQPKSFTTLENKTLK